MGLSILHKILRYSYPVFLLHYLNNLLDKVCEGCYIHSIMLANHIDKLRRQEDIMTTWKGIYYFPTFSAARAYAVGHNHPTDRIIAYKLGWAIQLRVSGPYVGK